MKYKQGPPPPPDVRLFPIEYDGIRYDGDYIGDDGWAYGTRADGTLYRKCRSYAGTDRKYLAVSLSKGGKKVVRALHVLVAHHFIGPRPEGMEVLHGEGGDQDNRPSNLSYGTRKQNQEDRKRDGTWGLKLSADQARKILGLKGIGRTMISVAVECDTTMYNVFNIWKGRTWKHLHEETVTCTQ